MSGSSKHVTTAASTPKGIDQLRSVRGDKLTQSDQLTQEPITSQSTGPSTISTSQRSRSSTTTTTTTALTQSPTPPLSQPNVIVMESVTLNEKKEDDYNLITSSTAPTIHTHSSPSHRKTASSISTGSPSTRKGHSRQISFASEATLVSSKLESDITQQTNDGNIVKPATPLSGGRSNRSASHMRRSSNNSTSTAAANILSVALSARRSMNGDQQTNSSRSTIVTISSDQSNSPSKKHHRSSTLMPLADPSAPPLKHSSSQRVVKHLQDVHAAIWTQLREDEKEAELEEELLMGDGDTGVGLPSAAQQAKNADEMAGMTEQQRIKHLDAKYRLKINPFLNLPGRKMMMKAAERASNTTGFTNINEKALTSLTGSSAASVAAATAANEQATQAALLAVLPKRRNEKERGSSASSKKKVNPPTVAELLTRQEWIRDSLKTRWMQVRDEVEAQNASMAAIATTSEQAATLPPAASKTPSPIPSRMNTARKQAAPNSTSGGTGSPATTTSTIRLTPLTHSNSKQGTRVQSAAKGNSLFSPNPTSSSDELLTNSIEAEDDSLDPDFDPSWDFGEGSPVFKKWYRQELKKLNHTAYDAYVAQYKLIAAGALVLPPGSPPASDPAASSTTTVTIVHQEANPLHQRIAKIQSDWKKKFPPVLQPRASDSDTTAASATNSSGSHSSSHATSTSTKHNPVLIPVIDRKLMDLSKPIDEVYRQIQREEGSLWDTSNKGGMEEEESKPSTATTARKEDDEEEAKEASTSLTLFQTGASTALTLPKDKVSAAAAVSATANAFSSATPRTRYNEQQSLTLKNLVNLLMKLDERALRAIRAEFAQMDAASSAASPDGTAAPGGLIIYDFVLMACTHISDCNGSDEDLKSLVEMFREIDVNGDSLMEWDEFTSHLVQLAVGIGANGGGGRHATEASSSTQGHFIPHSLTSASTSEEDFHSRPCELLKYCGSSGCGPNVKGLNKLLLIERNSRLLKIYNLKSLSCLQTVRCRASILAVEYLPQRSQVVVACSDRTLQFWSYKKSTTNWSLELTWQLAASCMCLEYGGKDYSLDDDGSSKAYRRSMSRFNMRPSMGTDDESGAASAAQQFNLLYTGDTNGRIICWNLDRAEIRWVVDHAHNDVIISLRLITDFQLTSTPVHNKNATVAAPPPIQTTTVLVSTGLDSVVKIWDCCRPGVTPTGTTGTGGKQLQTLHGHSRATMFVTFHPTLQLLISGGLDPFALVWPSPKTNGVSTLPIMRLGVLTPMSQCIGLEILSPSTPEIIVGDSLGGFQVYDLRNGVCIQSFHIPRLLLGRSFPGATGGGHASKGGHLGLTTPTNTVSLNSLCYVHGQGLLIIAGPKLFSFKRTEGVASSKADDEALKTCIFDSDALVFITTSPSGMKIWNALNGALVREEKGFEQHASLAGTNAPQAHKLIHGRASSTLPTITAMCMDDRHRRAYLGLSNGLVLNVNINTGAILSRIYVSPNEISCLLYHSPTKQVIAGSWNGHVTWMDDLLTHITRATHGADQSKDIIAIATSSEYKLIASIAADSTLCLYEERQGPYIMKWHLPVVPTCLVFLSPYPFLCVGDQNGGCAVFDIQAPFNNMATNKQNIGPGGMLFYIDHFNNLPLTPHSSPKLTHRDLDSDDENENEETDKIMEIENVNDLRVKLSEALHIDISNATAKGATPAAIAPAVTATAGATKSNTASAKTSARANANATPGAGGSSHPSARKFPSGSSHPTSRGGSLLGGTRPSTSSGLHPALDEERVLGSLPQSTNISPRTTTETKHPAIIQLKFEPIHKYLLMADDAGYIKVYPLGYALLRRFHPTELTSPSSPFHARIFKPVGAGVDDGKIIRSGWSQPVIAAQPHLLETLTPVVHHVKNKESVTLEKLANLAHDGRSQSRSVGPGAKRGHGHASHGSMHLSMSSNISATSATPAPGMSSTTPPAHAPNATSSTAAPKEPPPSTLVYAPASLTYPPMPTKASIQPLLIKQWNSHDTHHALQHLQPILQIQAHQDCAHGVDMILDTLYEPTLVSWSFDGACRLWNARTGERIGSLMQGHNNRTTAAIAATSNAAKSQPPTTHQREEAWQFQYDLTKHQIREAQFFEEAFKRPPSPVREEEEEAAALAKQQKLITTMLEEKSATNRSIKLLVPELLRLTSGSSDSKESIEPVKEVVQKNEDDGDDDVGVDASVDDTDEVVDIDGAYKQTEKRERARQKREKRISRDGGASDSDTSPVRKGDTFITDVDGTSPPGSHKKKKSKKSPKNRKATDPAFYINPFAATQAAAALSERSRQEQSHRSITIGVEKDIHGSYSTSVTPLQSPSPKPQSQRGMAYSQSQPVLPTNINQTNISTPKGVSTPKSLVALTPTGGHDPATPGSGAQSVTRSSPSRNEMNKYSAAPFVHLPQRTAQWRTLYPAVNSLPTKQLVANLHHPSASVERGNLSRLSMNASSTSGDLEPQTKKTLKELTLFTSNTSTASIINASASPTVPVVVPSLASPTNPAPMYTTPHPLLRLSSRRLPQKFKGKPRLGVRPGRVKPMRTNPITGQEETDSEAEREEEARFIAEEEEDRKRRSWWTPSNPALQRKPSTLIKKVPSMADLDEDMDENGHKKVKHIHTLHVNKKSLILTDTAARHMSDLTHKLYAAQRQMAIDQSSTHPDDNDPNWNLSELEHRRRVRADDLSEWANYNK